MSNLEKLINDHWNKQTVFMLILFVINIFLSVKLRNCGDFCVKSFSSCDDRIINTLELTLPMPHKERLPSEPSLEYERKRRRLRATIIHLWEYIKNQIYLMKTGTHFSNSSLDAMWATIAEHKVFLLNDWKLMTDNDGYNEWRKMEAEKLSSIVQRRFDYLMNPPNCSTTKYFKCHGEWPCGWGCQMSQHLACFNVAYGIGRTLYFYKTPDQFYEPDESKYYEPISRTCPEIPEELIELDWPGNEIVDVIRSPSQLREFTPRILYNIPKIPADLSARIDKVFEEPAAWWSGQINKLLFKLTNKSWQKINATINRIGFEHPIVGIHIRRGNKKAEADFQPVWRYMAIAAEYFDQLELTQKVNIRRIYLSTDDQNVADELRKTYPGYHVISSHKNFTGISKYERVNISSFDVLTDVMLLSLSDFFVGTFSSNLGRRMLEFRYSKENDAMQHVFSLDNRFFEYGEIRQKYRVIVPHKPKSREEISAEVGDIFEPDFGFLKVLDQYGFMPVVNNTLRKKGYLPSFKLEKILDVTDFPTFGIVE